MAPNLPNGCAIPTFGPLHRPKKEEWLEVHGENFKNSTSNLVSGGKKTAYQKYHKNMMSFQKDSIYIGEFHLVGIIKVRILIAINNLCAHFR